MMYKIIVKQDLAQEMLWQAMTQTFEIKLFNYDKVAIIDIEDKEKVLSHNDTWYPHPDGYARTYSKLLGHEVLMHVVVTDFQSHKLSALTIDHDDKDKLNNRKYNLKLVDFTQQALNKAKHKNTSSKYKGVFYKKATGKWNVVTKRGRTNYWGGSYKTEDEAALAANELYKKVFPEYKLPLNETKRGS
jgi:hypothetical protein